MLMPANRRLALLIVVATGAFAVGVAIERSQESGTETGAEVSRSAGSSAEGTAARESAEAGHVEGEASGETHADSSEKLLGIDPESVGLVIVAVIVSVALAAAAWLRPDLPGLLLLVALAMAVFAVLDVREFIHQLDESRTGLALLVALVTVLHGGAAVIAFRRARNPDPMLA
jgi:hypothetical protein